MEEDKTTTTMDITTTDDIPTSGCGDLNARLADAEVRTAVDALQELSFPSFEPSMVPTSASHISSLASLVDSMPSAHSSVLSPASELPDSSSSSLPSSLSVDESSAVSVSSLQSSSSTVSSSSGARGTDIRKRGYNSDAKQPSAMAISLPVDPDEQAHFLRDFYKYEGAVRRTAAVNIQLQPESATIRYLFFRVTAEICSTIVFYMNWFSEEEGHHQSVQVGANKSTKKQQQQKNTVTPRDTALALYKMKEFYIPVPDRPSYDQELLCYVCKLRPIFKPCQRLHKKLSISRYNSKCLQCFVEHKLCTDSTSFEARKTIFRDSLSCPCHKHHNLLIFPSFMMYASESSHKIVIRSRVMKEMIAMFGLYPHMGIMPVTTTAFASPISAPLFASSSWTLEKHKHADKHYIYQVISDYLMDHFMVCSGACAEMRKIIRVTGASQRSVEFTKLVSLFIGGSHSMSVLEPASPRFDIATMPDSTPAQRLHLILQRLVGTNAWQRAESFTSEHMRSRSKDNYYCNVCQKYIYSVYSTTVRLCPPDSSYLISKRQKEYSPEKTTTKETSDEEAAQMMDTREDDSNSK